MMKNWKRCLSVVMTLAMLVGVLPTAAFAEGPVFAVSDATYDGNVKTPQITVDGNMATPGSDYTLTVEGGKVLQDAGSYTLHIIGAGSYEGTNADLTFTINQAEWPIKEADVSVAATHEYDNTSPTVTVSGGTEGSYTVTYKKEDETLSAAPVNAGEYSVIVSPTANYLGEPVTKSFSITKKEILENGFTLTDCTYNGNPQKPDVMLGDTKLDEGTDYTIECSNNTAVGTASAKVTFTGNYSGREYTKEYTINPIPTTGLSLAVAQPYAYNEKAPAVTVKNGGETALTTGFTLSYKVKNGAALGQAPVVPGEYTVTAIFDDNYAKNGENNFTLSQNYSITKAEITSASVTTAYDFCHSNDTPVVTVTVGGRTLTADTDYTVDYTDAGSTRTITVTSKGNHYTGIGTKTQTILPDTAPTLSGVESNKAYHTKPTVTVTGDNLVKVFVKQGTGSTETEHTATTTDGKTQASFVLDFSTDAYTIRAVDKAGKSYTLATNVTVSRKPITFAMVTITGLDDVTYDGTAKVATKIEIMDGEYKLEAGEGKDYTVGYTNNTKAGTATVTITGIGNYTGTVSKTFTIKPKALTSTALSGIVDKTYTGSPIEQDGLTVKDGDSKILEKGSDKDYTVSYTNNTNPGTAKVTVVLRGNYTGTLEKTFTIGKDLPALENKIRTLAAKTTLTYAEKQQIKQLKAAYDALSAADKATVDREVGSALMTSFKNKASAAAFKLLNKPSVDYYKYVKGTSSNVVIQIDADYSRTHVTEIRMGKNLTVIDPANYTVTEGSVVVTLSSSYLKQIKDAGKYNLYIDLMDTQTGHTETVQTVVRVVPATDIPQTGDPFRMNLWVGLLGASVLALAGLGVYEVVKKKKNAQKRLEAAMELGEEPSDEANTNE